MISTKYILGTVLAHCMYNSGSAQYVHNSVKLRHARSYGVAIASSNFALYRNDLFSEINRSRAKKYWKSHISRSHTAENASLSSSTPRDWYISEVSSL